MRRYIARITVVTPRKESEHPDIDQFNHLGTNQFPITQHNIDDLSEMAVWLLKLDKEVDKEWGAFIEVYPDVPKLQRYGKMFSLEYEEDIVDSFQDTLSKIAMAVRLIESRLI